MNNPKDSIAFLGVAFVLAAIPFVAKSDPMNTVPTTQSAGVPGGQTPNGQSANPNQITNRDANQPAQRQKQEINNTTPDFPTAMNPGPVANQAAPSPMPRSSMPATVPTTRSATTRGVDPAMDAANDAVQKAQSAYDHERQIVIASLQNKPSYRSALAQRNLDSARIPVASPTTAPSLTIVNQANAKLAQSQVVTQMEERAIASNPKASAAKAQLERAIAYRNRLSSTAATQP